MAAVLLALGAAICYGGSDFVAGLASRRTHFAVVGLIAQVASSTVVLAAALVMTLASTTGLGTTELGGGAVAAFGWGALSGIGSGVGTLALYRGLARARVSVVAPLSAVLAAALPVLVGLLTGDRPTMLAIAGTAAAVPAVWLVSIEPNSSQPNSNGLSRGRAESAKARPAGLVDGLVAGAGFALLFVALGQVGDGHGLWPVGLGQAVSILPAVLAVLLFRRRPGADVAPESAEGGTLVDGTHPGNGGARQRAVSNGDESSAAVPRGDVSSAAEPSAVVRGAVVPSVVLSRGVRQRLAQVSVGLLGAAATVLYFAATNAGLLTVVAVLTALYPAITIGLAVVVLGERLGRAQILGLVLAAAAVLAIAVG